MAKITKVDPNEANLTDQQKEWWNEIKNHELEIYGLADQHIGDYAKPMNMEPDSLYLTIKAPAAVPAIETALSSLTEIEPTEKIRIPKFSFNMSDKYMVIKPSEGKIVKGANGKSVFIQNRIK
jgi:hypothetical protein